MQCIHDAFLPVGKSDVDISGFTAGLTVIDVTANGATWTQSGDTVSLDVSAVAFNANTKISIRRNGVEVETGVEVIWDSATTLHFTDDLYTGETIYVYVD